MRFITYKYLHIVIILLTIICWLIFLLMTTHRQQYYLIKSGRLNIQPGEVVAFHKNGQYLVSGFSLPEPGWVWSEGPTSKMLFFMGTTKSNVLLTFKVLPALPKSGMALSVVVKANGIKVSDWAFRNGEIYPAEKTIEIPQKLIEKDGKLEITFEYSETTRPKSLGINNDTRQLALQFINVTRK